MIDKFKLQTADERLGRRARAASRRAAEQREVPARGCSPDNVLKSKQNTEAVEVAPEHADRRPRDRARAGRSSAPLEEVQAADRQALTQQKAAELAQAGRRGPARQAAQGRDAGRARGQRRRRSRARGARGCTRRRRRPCFAPTHRSCPRMPASEAPGGRFVLYRISKVIDGDSVDPRAAQGSGHSSWTRWRGRKRLARECSSLKQKADVKIDEKKLDKSRAKSTGRCFNADSRTRRWRTQRC